MLYTINIDIQVYNVGTYYSLFSYTELFIANSEY